MPSLCRSAPVDLAAGRFRLLPWALSIHTMVNRKRRPRSAQPSTSASPAPSATPPAPTPPPAPTTTETTTSDASDSDGKPGLGSCGVSAHSGQSEVQSAAAAPLLACLTLSEGRISRSTTYTTAGVAAVLYEDFIRWVVTEVAVRHRLSTHLARSRALTSHPATSASPGNALYYGEKGVNAECSNCHKFVSASRYAPHLEKCLGRGGRVSSRAASARLKASAERAEREDNDEPAAPRRRRNSSQDPDEGQPKNSKRRRASPVPGSAIRTGLPPSGRSRGM